MIRHAASISQLYLPGTEVVIPRPYDGRRIRTQMTWEILEDPDTLGGFRPGARLGDIDVQCMLRDGCFTIGTRLRHDTHGEHRVALIGRLQVLELL